MTDAHTHNHDYQSGRLNLVGQQKPEYLEVAIEKAAQAWVSHIANVDIESTTPDDWLITRKHAVECEELARQAYNRWQQELCPHTYQTWHGGTMFTSQGEPDDDDYEQVVCMTCHKQIG